jgi:hypothetical protein
MPQSYFKNFDDGYSDPELIAAQYQIGRNAFFEVQLALAEYADAQNSASGGVAGSPDLAAAIGVGTSTGGGGGFCPERSQWVRVENHKSLKAANLIGREGLGLYNPITRNFNKLTKATLHKDMPLVLLTAGRAKNLVSDSHQIITRPFDRVGKSVRNYQSGDVLTFDNAVTNKQKNFNIYQDVFTIESVGRGDVVEIELETEYIYVSGVDKNCGVVAHNRKPLIED